jgi:hypothetical protein
VDQPEPGLFRCRLVRRGPWVPAAIRHEAGLWWAELNGERLEAAADPAHAPKVFEIWLSGHVIDRAEYEHMQRVRGFAERYAPAHPGAKPREPIVLAQLPPVY